LQVALSDVDPTMLGVLTNLQENRPAPPQLDAEAPDPWEVVAGDHSQLAPWQEAGWAFSAHDCGYTMTYLRNPQYSRVYTIAVTDVDAFRACAGDDYWRLAPLKCAGWTHVFISDYQWNGCSPDGRCFGELVTPPTRPKGINIWDVAGEPWDWLADKARDFFGLGGGEATLTVPDLTGLSFADAGSVLDEAGFRICACEQANCCLGNNWVYGGEQPTDDPDEVGRVVAQQPAAGTVVRVEQATVGVRFWLGAEGTTDTTTGTTTGTTSGTTTTSTSTSSSTSTSTSVTTSTTTTAPPTTVMLKNYSGWQCSAARADLQALGLVAPACEFSWYTWQGLGGTVDSQEPAPGTTVTRGSTVQLWQLEVAVNEDDCDACGGHWNGSACVAP